jgi:hypothetical protein
MIHILARDHIVHTALQNGPAEVVYASYLGKQVALAASMKTVKRDLRDVARVLLNCADFPDPYASEKERARFDRDAAAQVEHGIVQIAKAKMGYRPERPRSCSFS